MTGPTVEWGDYTPPKTRREIPGLEVVLEMLRSQPGRWARVIIPGYSHASAGLIEALERAGCGVVTRRAGAEVHACILTEVEEGPGAPD